ncbi:ATP-binding protein [Paenibacillus ginsengarvi]|uniref:histidine kinase n=1 Tax=Paenibacillus ginsengarvi TaxID=400777 RepID=A0A3B0BLX6_9BACL|nr:ATP-binding protein [Paenibacillus ginsengarvi]RKN74172.1 response regulator [Paenibacillus ginsengarvi]
MGNWREEMSPAGWLDAFARGDPAWISCGCLLLAFALLVAGQNKFSRKGIVYEAAITLGFWTGTAMLGYLLYRLDDPDQGSLGLLLLVTQAFGALLAYRLIRLHRQSGRLAAELQNKKKANHEFVAGAARELRAPLQHMSRIANSMLRKDWGRMTVQQADQLQLLAATGERSARLIEELADWSKLEEGTLTIVPAAANVRVIADNAIDRVRSFQGKDGVRLVNHVPEGLPAVLADAFRLTQVLSNLLAYGSHRTAQGTITVSASFKKTYVEIEVTESGSGMPEKQPVNGGNESGEANAESPPWVTSGLGLKLTKRLVEMQGGSMSITQQPGNGFTCSFRLPAAAKAEGEGDGGAGDYDRLRTWSHGEETMAFPSAEAGRQEPFQAVSSPGDEEAHVLIVDDDPANLRMLESLLTGGNVRVSRATSGDDALRKLSDSLRPDLVVLDLALPGLSGTEVCRKIRERDTLYDMPVLMMTGAGRDEDIGLAFAAGANDFLAKPARATELRARVRTLIQMKRSVRDRLRMESALLHAQIKPHFVFNTINSIAALSHDSPDKMRRLLSEFAHYLRESFRYDSMSPLVEFEQELRLIRAYVFIEATRFGERLKVKLDVPAGMNFYLPPLTIQPIVENAIRHGVMKRKRGGEVRLGVTVEEGDFVIRIHDDGIGIEEGLLARLQAGRGLERGIGLANINSRLVQQFGRGIDITSEPGIGTTVTLRLRIEEAQRKPRQTTSILPFGGKSGDNGENAQERGEIDA